MATVEKAYSSDGGFVYPVWKDIKAFHSPIKELKSITCETRSSDARWDLEAFQWFLRCRTSPILDLWKQSFLVNIYTYIHHPHHTSMYKAFQHSHITLTTSSIHASSSSWRQPLSLQLDVDAIFPTRSIVSAKASEMPVLCRLLQEAVQH